MNASTPASADAWDRAVRAGVRAWTAAGGTGDPAAVEAAVAVGLVTYADQAARPLRHALGLDAPRTDLRYVRAVCRCGWTGDLHRGQWAPSRIRNEYEAHLDAQ